MARKRASPTAAPMMLGVLRFMGFSSRRLKWKTRGGTARALPGSSPWNSRWLARRVSGIADGVPTTPDPPGSLLQGRNVLRDGRGVVDLDGLHLALALLDDLQHLGLGQPLDGALEHGPARAVGAVAHLALRGEGGRAVGASGGGEGEDEEGGDDALHVGFLSERGLVASHEGRRRGNGYSTGALLRASRRRASPPA